MDSLPTALSAFARYSQFIIFRLQNSQSRTNKLDKIPVSFETLAPTNAHDPKNWLDINTALHIKRRLGNDYGIGFVFTANDPFFFLDIDECYEGTKWSDFSLKLLGAFPGAAVEVSTSQRGLHVFGCGTPPPHSCKNTENKIELYTSSRFVALTGLHAYGSADVDCTQSLRWLVENYFPLEQSSAGQWTITPCEGWQGIEDDDKLIERALKSRSAKVRFGHAGVTFRDLWEANADVLSKQYPDANRAYDASSADAALAQHLAFWTGNNCDRIHHLMLRSALVREKWNRADYLPRTIEAACGRQKEWHKEIVRQTPALTASNTPSPILNDKPTYLTPQQQILHFTGCVYVIQDHKIMVPGGELLTPERFRASHGGKTFVMDHLNERTTRNAFEAFTESQAIIVPKVNASCFLPAKDPGTIIELDGEKLVNIYYPVITPRVKGDIAPFKRHCDKLFGDNEDQLIFISYLASLLQYLGYKFQWCPLIQGVEGNGKTFFTRVIAFGLGRKYCHFPKASEIAGRFNDWLYAKLFIGVEDIYCPDNREVIEILKPMITSERQEIEAKGGAKVTKDICANFLLNSNHKDGLRKRRNDRRFAPFFTLQQQVEDLVRDGLTEEYFAGFYGWAQYQDGYAIICEWLESFEIPAKYDPTRLCKRAPITSSTEAAIHSGMGRVEQEVLEAIGRGDVGFRGGWISSNFLDRLLIQKRADILIPPRKRLELLQTLGYDRHPFLDEGRTNNAVMPDGCKVRLYINSDNRSRNINNPHLIAKMYAEDQALEPSKS